MSAPGWSSSNVTWRFAPRSMCAARLTARLGSCAPESSPMPSVRDLLAAADLGEVAVREPGRSGELVERDSLEAGEDLAGEHVGICDRVGVFGLPFLQLALPPRHRRGSFLGRLATVGRVDLGRSQFSSVGTAGRDEGVVAVALVARQTVIAVDAVSVGKFPAATLATRLGTQRPWRRRLTATTVAPSPVGSTVRLGQRRRQPINPRITLDEQGGDLLGDRGDQLPPGWQRFRELMRQR